MTTRNIYILVAVVIVLVILAYVSGVFGPRATAPVPGAPATTAPSGGGTSQ